MTTQEVLTEMKLLAIDMANYDNLLSPEQIHDIQVKYEELLYVLVKKGEGIIMAINNITEEVAANRARAEVWRREEEIANRKADSLENTIKWLKNRLLLQVVEDHGKEDDKGKYMFIDGRKLRVNISTSIEPRPDLNILTLPKRFIRMKAELNKIEVNKAFKEIENGLGSGEDWIDALRAGFDTREVKTIRIY